MNRSQGCGWIEVDGWLEVMGPLETHLVLMMALHNRGTGEHMGLHTRFHLQIQQAMEKHKHGKAANMAAAFEEPQTMPTWQPRCSTH
mmetsp:Transcript_11998/g.31530  ORF Transcript_11998/g.31530 Transcript_11998/m.31530 type:complete len:87 (-) Transcript_11998:94-354(-)